MLFLEALTAFAQTQPYSPYSPFTVVDPCGGQPAFIGSAMIIEESHAVCPAAISTVSAAPGGPIMIVLSSANTGIQAGDSYRVFGVTGSLAGLVNNTSGSVSLVSTSGTTLTLPITSTSGGT